MRARNVIVLLCAVFLALTAVSQATTISYVGYVEGSQVGDWRTSTTAKTLDIDGNNVYGSLGGNNLSDTESSAIGQTSAGSTTLGWAGIAAVSTYYGGNATYASVDNNAGTANTYPGIYHTNGSAASFTFELTGTAGDYAGKTVRVGFMQDIIGNVGDYDKTLQLAQTVGGTGDSGQIYVRDQRAGDGVPEMYLFDITGIAAGDRFTVVAGALNSGTGTPYVSGFSFDIATVPEPSAVVLLATGLVGLLAYAWRKRK